MSHPNEGGHREEQLDRLLAECLRQVDSGSEPDFDRLADDFPELNTMPELREELAELLGTGALVDRMAGPPDAQRTTATTPPPAEPHPPAGTRPSAGARASADGQAETVVFQEATVPPAERLPLEDPVTDDTRDSAATPIHFGGYELLEIIGQGGMGVVYKARQINLDRIVAVKMIRSGRFAGDEDRQRFYNEAQAAGRLGHPGIVGVYQVGEVDGHHFYSMDYVAGTTLAELAGRSELTEERAARYLIAVADAIQHAHDRGILHRDLKPANVLIDVNDRVRITDFGLAKVLGEESGLTESGAALGTPGYMPPEQAAGRQHAMGPSSDVYSLGAILFALLTGEPPFRGKSIVETIMQVIHDEPVSPRVRNPRVSADLETICLKCLRKDPAQRYASARELAADLERFLAGESIQARPAGPLRRTLAWCGRIPLVAALIGRRVHQPTAWQRRANWVLLALPLVVIAAFALNRRYQQIVLPRRLEVASAIRGGTYHEFGEAFARRWQQATGRPAQVRTTSGSIENQRLLRQRQVDVALLQADMVGVSPIAIVAPLYDDFVHVVARRGRGIHSLPDLAGKRLALGEKESGMLRTAQKVLTGLRIQAAADLPSDVHFTLLEHEPRYDAAIITTSSGNPDLRQLLASGEFELIPIPLDNPLSPAVYHPVVIPQGCFREELPGQQAIPPQPVTTMATTTFLAVHRQASERLVRQLLDTLYTSGDLAQRFQLFDRELAREWHVYSFHPAAEDYFNRITSPTQVDPRPAGAAK